MGVNEGCLVDWEVLPGFLFLDESMSQSDTLKNTANKKII